MLQAPAVDTTQALPLMQRVLEPVSGLAPWQRVALLLVVGVAGHFLVRGLKAGTRWLLTSQPTGDGDRETELQDQFPKLATLISLVTSGLIFFIYFAAIGLALGEANVRITTYLASASVIGLAVGFGAQGLVQDIMTGLTLIFSDYLRIGDVVEITGQTGVVEHVGLRFTRLTNFIGATVVVPNRNIGQMSRFRKDVVRVYVDTRISAGVDPHEVVEVVTSQANGLRHQFPATVVSDPEVLGVLEAGEGAWSYVRVKFRIWPGQQDIISKVYQPALASALRRRSPDFQDWQVSVTFRADWHGARS